jgi:hypothetical protein
LVPFPNLLIELAITCEDPKRIASDKDICIIAIPRSDTKSSVDVRATSQNLLTFKIGRKYGFKIGWINGSISGRQKKDLFQCISSLAEIKQEMFHKSRFRIRSEYLL